MWNNSQNLPRSQWRRSLRPFALRGRWSNCWVHQFERLGCETHCKASWSRRVILMDKIVVMPVMKTDFVLRRLANGKQGKNNWDIKRESRSPFWNRQMKLLNSLFQLNETLIRWQAKCHIEVKCFIRKCLSCFSLSFRFSIRFKIHEHWLSTQREKKGIEKKKFSIFFSFVLTVQWFLCLFLVCKKIRQKSSKKTINRIDKL